MYLKRVGSVGSLSVAVAAMLVLAGCSTASVEEKLADGYAEHLSSDPRDSEQFAEVSAMQCEEAREIGVSEYLSYQLADRESVSEQLIATLMVSFIETCPDLYTEALELIDAQAILESNKE